MKRRRHTPEQIVRKLREADRLLAEGQDVPEVAKHLEVSEATYHRWRAQYGGLKMKRPTNPALISIERRRCYRIAAASTQPTPSSAQPAPQSTAHSRCLTPPASRPDRAATQALRPGTRWRHAATVSAGRAPHTSRHRARNAGATGLTIGVAVLVRRSRPGQPDHEVRLEY